MKKLVKALFILLVLLRVGQGFSKPPIPDSVEIPEDKERSASTIQWLKEAFLSGDGVLPHPQFFRFYCLNLFLPYFLILIQKCGYFEKGRCDTFPFQEGTINQVASKLLAHWHLPVPGLRSLPGLIYLVSYFQLILKHILCL